MKQIKILLIAVVLILGVCIKFGMDSLEEQCINNQKTVDQSVEQNKKSVEQNKKPEEKNNTSKEKADNKKPKKETTTKSKSNNINSNNKNNHKTTKKDTTKNKDNEKADSTGQECDVCGKFTPISDMCDCDGGIHHRGCKHKVYNCPRCGHSTTTNPNSPNFGCGWCGYPDEDIRINYCHICGKVVTGNNQYGECSDLCQSCGENINNSTTEDYNNNHSNNNNSSFDGASNDVTTNQPSKGYVYWTPSGKSYHSRRNCPTLKRSKVIYEEYNCPKTDPCNICY